MANEEHLALLKHGTAIWNDWRTSNQGTSPDLSEVDLSRANLSEVYLYGTDLRRADFSQAY